MKKFFGFGSSTPPPPPPPSRPPTSPAAKSPAPKSPPAAKDSGHESIVGRWKEPNGNDTTEFRADGSVLEKPASGESIRGRYSFEASRLKIKLEALTEELVFTATIKNDTLEMKDRDGQITHYRRV